MRRCDRHPSRENDPYVEFSFEKSLRKYETLPQKKIKLDIQALPKNNNIQQQSLQKYQSRVNKSQGKEVFKQLPQKQNNQRLVVQQQFKVINGTERNNFKLFENPKEVKKIEVEANQIQINEIISSIKLQRIQQQDQHFEAGQGLKEQNLEILSVSPNKSQKAFISKRQLKNDQQIQNSPNNLPLQIISSFGKQQSQQSKKSSVEIPKKLKQKQGRLNLTDNISVSLRSINKFKQSGISKKEIVEKLLKRMDFTEQEKNQVSLRLSQFLQMNQ